MSAIPSALNLDDAINENVADEINRIKNNLNDSENILDLTNGTTGDGNTTDIAEQCIGEIEESMEYDSFYRVVSSNIDATDMLPGEINRPLSEFARLFALLRDNLELADSFFTSRRSKTRAVMDARKSIEDFWEEKVAPLFNSNVSKPRIDTSHAVSNIDTSVQPISKRSGSYLRSMFYDMRADFAIVFGKTNVSGFYDTSFEGFQQAMKKCPKCWTPTIGKVNTIGKKVYIMHAVFCHKTPLRVTDEFLRFFTRRSFERTPSGQLKTVGRESGLDKYDKRDGYLGSSRQHQHGSTTGDQSRQSSRRTSMDKEKSTVLVQAAAASLIETEQKRLENESKRSVREDKLLELIEKHSRSQDQLSENAPNITVTTNAAS